MTARSIASSTARALGQSDSGSGSSNPFIITPSTATPVAGADTTWSTNAGDLGTPVSYSWDFGDGTTPQVGATPTHFFVGLGPYTVTCVVTYDDDSTDTDTQVISPTAPSANPAQTLIAVETFSSDITADNLEVGAFDSIQGALYNVYSVPVGPKLAGDSGIGYSGYSSFRNWAGMFDITNPTSETFFRQMGAWFRFEEFSATYGYCVFGQQTNTVKRGVAVTSSGELWWNDNGSNILKLRTDPIPLNKWVWIGMAFGGVQSGTTAFATVIYKEHDETEEIIPYAAGLAGASTMLLAGIGPFHASSNQNGKNRIAYATYHTVTDLADAGVPTEVVRPQTANHIYRVDPAGGDDANDGVTGAWQTIEKTNQMLSQTYRGIISTDVPGAGTTFQVGDSLEIDCECGSGSWLLIDTSVESFDVKHYGLRVMTEFMKIAPVEGETYVEYRPWVLVDSGDWTSEGGNIYSTPLADGDYPTGSDASYTRVWENEIFLAKAASLAALSGEAAGAFVWEAGKLYVKGMDLDSPASNGKAYRYSRHRPTYLNDPVGYQVVVVESQFIHVQGVKCYYSALNLGGSYVVGEVPGFSGGCLVETFDIKYTDKHSICWTIGATDSYIMTRNGSTEQGLGQALTSYMGTGSGNIHVYENITSEKSLLEERSSAGNADDINGNAPGIFYSHGGGGGRYLYVEIKDCDFGVNTVASEGAATQFRITNSQMGQLTSYGNVLVTGSETELYVAPALTGNVNTMTGITLTCQPGSSLSTPRHTEGDLFWTGCTFDFLELLTSTAVWAQPDTDPVDVTFTGNTVIFNSIRTQTPLFRDLSATEITEWDYNTYYIDPEAIFMRDFDDGTTVADRTYTQWLALGYDANSTQFPRVEIPVAAELTTNPSITGTTQVGSTLTAVTGTVVGTPTPTSTWQWLLDGSPISGATGTTYDPVTGDIGSDISVTQTVTNLTGSDFATSAEVGPITAFTPTNLVANGDFATGASWSLTAGLAIGSGVLTCDGTDSAARASQTVLTSGRFYQVVLDVIAISGGGLLTIQLGTDAATYKLDATGVDQVRYGEAVGATLFGIRNGGASVTWTVDNCRVYEVTNVVINGQFTTDTDWTKISGATISGGFGRANGVGGELKQACLTIGRTYDIQVYIASGSGDLTVYAGTNSGTIPFVALRSGRVTLTCAGNTDLRFVGNGPIVFDNVIAVDVT